LRVDPDNRLVADSLEADWNQKLRALAAVQEEYQRQQQGEDLLLDEPKRAQVLALATDFPRLWRDPATPHRERKRMVRLLLEDVTLLRAEQIVAQVRFRGGATRTLRFPLPRNAWQIRQIDPAVVAEIDRLLDDHTDGEVADILNARGLHPGVADRFSLSIIGNVRRKYGLEDRFTRLRRRGLLTQQEMAAALNVNPSTVKRRQYQGRLASVIYNDKGQRLYVPPAEPRLGACRRCGTAIPERGARGQLQKYCSVTCRTAAWRVARGWVRPRRLRLGVSSSL